MEILILVLCSGHIQVIDKTSPKQVAERSGYKTNQCLQRHNVNTPAHIKGWSYENTASDFEISDNVFARAAYRMVHIVAKHAESCPVMRGNTYAQKKGLMLGQFGENCDFEPPILSFDDNAKETITKTFGETDANVIEIE